MLSVACNMILPIDSLLLVFVYLLIFLQITKGDFEKFDYIFGMDDENMSALEHKAPKSSKAELHLLGAFDPDEDRIIRDPYYVSVHGPLATAVSQ